MTGRTKGNEKEHERVTTGARDRSVDIHLPPREDLGPQQDASSSGGMVDSFRNWGGTVFPNHPIKNTTNAKYMKITNQERNT